jgi:Domain of unknown function (DUF5063)
VDNPAQSAPVTEFVELTRSYCALVVEHAPLPASEFLQQVHSLLPRLYAAALLLPDIGWDAPDCEGRHTMSTLGRDLRAKFGALDHYRELFDPYASESEEPVIGSLSNDIADIYAELANGITCWDAGNHDGALWAWRFGFQMHWGKHLTSALRALYAWTVRPSIGETAD